MWGLASEWLLHELLPYLGEGDVYRFWVFAEDQRLERVCAFLLTAPCTTLAPLSHARAKHLAMAYGCWTAVCRLTKAPDTQRLSSHTVRNCVQEIQRHTTQIHDHADRETAMLTAAAPGTVPQFVMYSAAQHGNLETVIWLHRVARYDLSEALRIASRGGHGHVVAWLLDNASTAHWINPGCSVQTVFHFRDDPELGVCAWKVFYGEEQVDEAVFSSKWGFSDIGPSGKTEHRAADLAAISGDLDGVERVLSFEVLEDACTARGVEDTARAGHLHVLQWLHMNRREVFLDANVFHCAAFSGHLEVAQWATGIYVQDQGMDVTFEVIVRRGHLQVLQWLQESLPESLSLHLTEAHVAIACKEGHLGMTKWLVETRGLAVTPRCLSVAAMGGQLEVFQWVLSQLSSRTGVDFTLNPMLLRQAARGGKLDLVRWLVEERGLWGPSALAAAARGASIGIIEYLYSVAVARGDRRLDPRAPERPSSIYRAHFNVLAWRLRHGLTADHLTKPGFDRLRKLDAAFVCQQEQLGWSEHVSPHKRWPRTPSTMAQFRALLRLIIDVYDPAFLRSITWLPAWTVQHGTIQQLERLATIGHTHLFKPKMFRLLLQTSGDAVKVQWFLTKAPSLFSTRVVQWAVKLDRRRLLMWLLEEFMPAQEIKGVAHSSNLRFRCVQTAARSAQAWGRNEIACLLKSVAPTLLHTKEERNE